MSYINLDPNYFDHPKTKRLEAILGKGSAEYPIRLWCFCAKYHPKDGCLYKYSEAEIASILGWPGDAQALLQALLDVCYLEKDEKGLKVHHWKLHEGHIGMFKQRAIMAAKTRWGKLYPRRKSYNATSNATSNRQAILKQSSSNAPTVPTVPNHKNSPPTPSPGGEFDVAGSFEKVWKFYPRPLGKKEALRHFTSSVKSKEDLKRLAVAMDNYIAHIEDKKIEDKFIQHGSTWFGNWMDWENYNGDNEHEV